MFPPSVTPGNMRGEENVQKIPGTRETLIRDSATSVHGAKPKCSRHESSKIKKHQWR